MVLRNTVNLAQRITKIILGFVVLLAGLLMLVTPGPGGLVILVGLTLLASEFQWAKRLLDRLKEKSMQLLNTVRGLAR
ncbi:MAG: PGPGW domain-containing protein [Acidobacteriota bacterium]|jgi:uncharacterized protein (TIGR02611 family)